MITEIKNNKEDKEVTTTIKALPCNPTQYRDRYANLHSEETNNFDIVRNRAGKAGLILKFELAYLFSTTKFLIYTYIHSYMKNIMVRDEVYEKLQKMKKGKESFSDVILRLIEGRKMKGIEVLERYAGKLADEELERIVMEERKKFKVRSFDI